MPESDWVPYSLANCPFEKGLLFFSSTQGIYKCSICFREFTDSQIAPHRTTQPALEKQSYAVTGAFFQDTQPVSGMVTTSPPGNASTNLAQVGGSSVSLGAKTTANSIPVVLASDEAGLPVTGTFFQATQPISGTLAVTQSDLSADRTLRNTLEEMNGTLRELTDFMYTLRDQFQSVQTPVAVSNFPALQPVPVSNFPAVQVVSGTVSSMAPDLGEDRTLRNAVEEMNSTMREVADFIYTLRDQFQYVQTPVQGTVQVGNFPAPVSSISVSNLPALQPTVVPDGMQDRIVRNLLEEILITLQEMRGLSTLNEAARTSVNISSLEGIN